MTVASDTAPLARGAMVADKYRIDGVLGQGGMGIVYAATHTVSGKPVAVKWMLPIADGGAELTERFIQEARATALIDHPNVVDIYDVGVQDGSAYLVMERLHGESLAHHLERGRFTPADAVAILMPAMRGVAAAHARGVIHRDLKPDNIFLCEGSEGESREPKVLDFGISKITPRGDGRDMSLTRSGMVMGTPHYMSPEQVRGLADVDHRTDIYAFGVVLYEMLTDKHPFEADTYNDLIVKIVTTDPVPIREINPMVDAGLSAIAMRAMARDRSARFPNVTALALALEPYSSGARFTTAPGVPSVQADAFKSAPAAADSSLQPQQSRISISRMREGGARSWWALGVGLVLAAALAWKLLPTEPHAEALHAPPAAEPVRAATSAVLQAPAVSPQPLPSTSPTAVAAGMPAPLGADGHANNAATVMPPAGVDYGVHGAARDARERESVRTREGTRRRKSAHDAPDAARARPSRLPDDWDERLGTQLPPIADRPAATRAQSAAGGLSADDL